jgi:ribosomal protein S10
MSRHVFMLTMYKQVVVTILKSPHAYIKNKNWDVRLHNRLIDFHQNASAAEHGDETSFKIGLYRAILPDS